MKQKHRILSLLIYCLAMWGPASTQPLGVLLATADSANLELQALYQEYLAALEVAPQVGQLPDPEAGLGLFVLPVETRLGPQWGRLSISQMFPWKGTRQARKDVALTMARTRYEKIAATRLQLHYQVKAAYFNLYELEKRRQILRESLDLFHSLESVATTKMETGAASLADVLRIQVRIRELQTELDLLENRKTNPLANLHRLLNLPDTETILPADTLLPAALPYNTVMLLDSIRNNHPMIRMYSLQQEAARQQIHLNNLEGKPVIGAGLDYIAVGKRSDANPEHNGRDILGPRISVRIPVYRDKYRAKEQEEKLKIRALDLRKEDQYLEFRAALQQAFTNFEDSRLKHQLYSDQQKTVQTAIDLTLTEYSTSGKGFTALLELENQLIRYRLFQLEAVVRMHLARATVERYLF